MAIIEELSDKYQIEDWVVETIFQEGFNVGWCAKQDKFVDILTRISNCIENRDIREEIDDVLAAIT